MLQKAAFAVCYVQAGTRVDVLNWRRLQGSELAAVFARPNGIWSTLTHFLPGYRWSLSVHRGAGEPPFSDREPFIIVAANRHANQLYTLYGRLEHSSIDSPTADQIGKYLPRLTSRGALVCSLHCMGISAPAVDSKLCVSTRTVETQIGTVYFKLGISTKAELMRTVCALCDVPDAGENDVLALGQVKGLSRRGRVNPLLRGTRIACGYPRLDINARSIVRSASSRISCLASTAHSSPPTNLLYSAGQSGIFVSAMTFAGIPH